MTLRTDFSSAGRQDHKDDHLALHKLFNAGADYYPEVYGAVGDGTTDDTAAIQSAIDAAGAAGGGIVRLTQTYNIVPAIDFDFGIYTSYRVGLHVNNNNVFIVGPGTIVMRTLPDLGSSKRLGVLMFGNGGTESTTIPPLEAGTWTRNVGCSGVTFDFTEYTKSELLAISTLGGVTIGFMYVEEFRCSYNTLKNAYSRGGYGAILTLVSSRFAEISYNNILGCSQNAMWVDGARGLVVHGNKIIGEDHGVTDDVAGAGIVLANNTDNDTGGDDNIFSENIVINAKGVGIFVGGLNNVVCNNRLTTIHGGSPMLRLSYGDRTEDYPCEDTIVTGNLFRRIAGNVANTAVDFVGTDLGEQETAVKVERTLFSNNTINSAWSIGIDLQEQAQNNIIVNNVNKAAMPIQENATATGNTTEPNY